MSPRRGYVIFGRPMANARHECGFAALNAVALP
jgi:hypothetical protein